jgi:glycosyltransferase involved in cell wall biosynthesis
MLDRLQPEAIHCHDFDTLPVGLWWGKSHKIPVIYDAHEYYADLVLPRLKPPFGPAVYAIIKWLEFHASRRVSAIITVDETLAAHYQPTSQPVLIIGHYPSLNFASHQAPVFSRDQLVLLYAGRLSTDRGILDYLQILRLLRQLGIPARLRLAGVFTPASEQDQFTEQARGLESWLDILGWVAYQDLPDLVSEADVGLALLHPVPRYTVALPVKLFEYMAAGLPVLASDFLPIRHVVVPSKAGALLLPGDPHLAAGILESWWKDPTIPQRLGQNARQAVLERYNWEMLAEKLADLYTSLVP